MTYNEFVQAVGEIRAKAELDRAPHFHPKSKEQQEIRDELTFKIDKCSEALKVSPNLGEYMLNWNKLQGELFFGPEGDGTG